MPLAQTVIWRRKFCCSPFKNCCAEVDQSHTKHAPNVCTIFFHHHLSSQAPHTQSQSSNYVAMASPTTTQPSMAKEIQLLLRNIGVPTRCSVHTIETMIQQSNVYNDCRDRDDEIIDLIAQIRSIWHKRWTCHTYPAKYLERVSKWVIQFKSERYSSKPKRVVHSLENP